MVYVYYTPEPHINLDITALCKVKSGFLAYQSAGASTSTRIAMGFMILLFIVPIFLCTAALHPACLDPTASRRQQRALVSKKTRAQAFAAATILLGLVAFFLTTYIYTVNHQFYCEESPKWFRWNKEWLITAFVPGFWTAISFANWVYLLANLVLGHINEQKLISVPFGLWVIAAIFGPFLAAAAAAGFVTWMVLYTLFWLLARAFMCEWRGFDPFLRSTRRDNGKRATNAASIEMEEGVCQ